MEPLLIVAIVVISLAIAAQAAALLGIYFLSREVADNVTELIEESRNLTPTLERIAENLRATSEDVASIGQSARIEAHQIGQTINQANDTIRAGIQSLHSIVTTVEERVSAPFLVRSAIWKGLTVGVRTYLRRRRVSEPEEQFEDRRAA
ncbi:MAG TPA: hypothetical protein VFY29_17335 [Terriglobia bacterium]|nr:hypothetical protein [Terriglobia bacterium]